MSLQGGEGDLMSIAVLFPGGGGGGGLSPPGYDLLQYKGERSRAPRVWGLFVTEGLCSYAENRGGALGRESVYISSPIYDLVRRIRKKSSLGRGEMVFRRALCLLGKSCKSHPASEIFFG